jgi:hydroxymethylbilane synthase
VLIARDGLHLADLPPGARLGTSSLRRRVQLAALRPDLVFADIRGNIDSRLRQVRDGRFDAVVLARAGLARAGLLPAECELLDFDRMLPAPGQGALGLEIRTDDAALADLLAPLDHPPSRLAVAAERALLGRLAAGCHAPVAALGQLDPAGQLHLVAFVATPDGRRTLRDQLTGPAPAAEALGRRLADRLLDRGAAELLEPQA